MKFKLLIALSTVFILSACSEEVAEVPVIDVESYINKELALSLGNRINEEDLALATTNIIIEEPINELDESIAERKRIMKKAGKYNIYKEPVYDYTMPNSPSPNSNTGGNPNVDQVLDRLNGSIEDFIKEAESQEGLTEIEKYNKRLYNDIVDELTKTKEWAAYTRKNKEITEKMANELFNVKDLKQVEIITNKILQAFQNTEEYAQLIKVRDVMMEKRHLELEAQLIEESLKEVEEIEDTVIEEPASSEAEESQEQEFEEAEEINNENLV